MNVRIESHSSAQNANEWGTRHYRRIDLSAFAGKTISQIYLTQESSTTANPWSIYYTDVSIVSVDGSVRPLYNRETSVSLTHSGTSAGTASVNHLSNAVLSPDTTTTFYHGDQLGSSRIMSSVNGYPVWQATYLPFGYEYNPQITVNHYKFTGKERDSESGLDNFGARYDASSMGRFMTPDPLMASAKVWDPQTWNRYAYALNNPLKYVDPTGMNEVTAAQCAQDKNCVSVNVNVIYDKNANDGKGLTDKQKSDFEKGQLQSAKDQYGNADIHLNVSYTAGALSTDNGKTTVSGLQAGALNVVVTDQVETAGSGMAGKTAVSFINPNSNDLPHEMAHQFMGDTQGWRNWVMKNDPVYMFALTLNAVSDYGNDFERAWMRNIDQHSGPLSYYPLASAFHHNAAVFQRSIQPTTRP